MENAMTTKVLESKSLEATELSLDDLDQATGGRHHGGHGDGVFYGLLAGGIAVVGAIIVVGILA
jgi:hypothetical protein